ncbi:MAG: alpha/beta hydrolase [Coprobacillus sp.]
MSYQIDYKKSHENNYLDKDLIEYKKNKKPKSVGNPYHYMGLPIGDMRDNMGCINIDLSKDIETSHYQLENVSFYAYNPLTLVNNAPCIFYIHGGGFIGGSTKTLENPCKYLSEKNQCLVINIDYRLAPENPYPIPMNDCLDVINYVYNDSSFIFDRKKIFIAGDSAGGNLALACLIKDYEIHQYKRFAGGMIYYPVVDITSKKEYWQYDETLFNGYKDEMVKACYESLKGLEDMIDKLYVQSKGELMNPYLSPLYLDDFTIFPDLLVMYAEYDYLRLQTEAFVKKAKASGINVEDYCFLGINHAFVDLLGIIEQSQKSLDIVSQFIEKRK